MESIAVGVDSGKMVEATEERGKDWGKDKQEEVERKNREERRHTGYQ